MRRAILILSGLALLVCPATARQRIYGYCSKGGQAVMIHGSSSTTKWLQTFPSCTVTVYQTGTLTLSTLYSDNAGTAKPNPFVADSTSYWFFYADNGRYDVSISNTGTNPISFPDILANDSGGGSPGTGTVTNTLGALTLGLPVIGNGGADITVGTKTGTTTDFATFTGSAHSG